jgi:4-diphosphocytidyl-2-C-methyl-D-erythritol kinase
MADPASPTEPALSEPARAKVNLFLHVVGRRADGYHLLDSLVVFPEAADLLRAAPAKDLSLAVEGPFAATLAGEADNLVLRAAHRLADATGATAGACLVLEKNLPVASGIGGGSADAAAALRLLARLWNVDVPPGLALTLGADVPVCLGQAPARMGGIGEVLAPAPALPDCGILLANPGLAVATPAIFRARAAAATGYSPAATLPAAWPDAAAMARDLAALSNDLQAPAIALCPAIAEVLAALSALPGCRLARMSGSGATCFALFDTPASALAAAALTRPGWWIWGGALAAQSA